MDLVIRNGLIEAQDQVLDVGIFEGKIARLATRLSDSAPVEIDAKGCIVAPGFVDAHVHMDKCLTANRSNNGRAFPTLDQMIAAQRSIKKGFTADDVCARALRAAAMSVRHGTTLIRTYVEADPIVEDRCVRGLLQAKAACKGALDIQTIAFPQEGWLASADGYELDSRPHVIQAMRQGTDVVGGNVNLALWQSDPIAQVAELFAIAREHNAHVDMHLDNSDNPVAFTLPYVAKKAIEYGWQGKVSVGHIPSLTAVPDPLAHRTIDLMKEARVNVCVLPTRIRLTRVRELLEAGVNVTFGTDNMQDAFVTMGDADMLKTMLLFAQVTNMGSDEELRQVFRICTVNGAKALGAEEGYGIAEGNRADLVVLEAPSVPEAIRYQARKRAVVKGGRLVAEGGHLRVPLQG